MSRDPRDPVVVVIKNLLTIQRFGNSLKDLTTAEIDRLFSRLSALLVENDPTVSPAHQRIALVAFMEKVGTATDETYARLTEEVGNALASFADRQADGAVVQLRAILGTTASDEVWTVALTAAQARAIANGPISGAPLQAWFSGQSRRVRFEVERQLQLGLTRGETVGDLVRRIRGRFVGYQTIDGERRPRYAGGILDTSTRHAETLVRTAANHVAAEASMEVFRSNADVVGAVEWTSALDARVCEECGGLDGQQWDLGDPKLRRPPAHPNDRCVLVPVIRWDRLGLEPPPDGTRASADGQVPSDVRYEEWLKGRPPEVQDEVLGPKRAELFRQGRVSLRDLVRTDGTRIPLNELVAT